MRGAGVVRVVDRRLAGPEVVVDQQARSGILGRVRQPDRLRGGPVRDRQDARELDAAVSLLLVADDADTREVDRPRLADQPVVGGRIVGDADPLQEVGAGDQGRLDQGPREIRHPIARLPAAGRVEALGEVVAHDRPGAGGVGGGVRGPEVVLVELRLDRIDVVVVPAAEHRHPDRPGSVEQPAEVLARSHHDRRGPQGQGRRRPARRPGRSLLLQVARARERLHVVAMAADRDDVLGGRRR